ncbi:hypothetical protein [Desulfobacter postgatei]|uniref:Uncharacterized protein n=1 Tax=Desulfobacter postgatei 2ac9 TaxID=879212 RepID=I5B172_9BACT|nr:hypothetical protein [Desulfobacter postgatei]EIM63235.1 hypothetical protein DespoDRAFT_01275 [Desulfobacter postgatei 2ac9]
MMSSQAMEPEQVQTDYEQSDPNRVLWLAVINQAVDDYQTHLDIQAGRYKADPYKATACRGAFHWITQAGDWFCQVCYMADLDPESIQMAARRRAVQDIRINPDP